jgi:hypothetical protein
MTTTIATRVCLVCKDDLPLNRFGTDNSPSGRDGHATRCRDCKAQAARDARAAGTQGRRKTCTRCKARRSVDWFAPNPLRRGGRSSMCVTCHNELADGIRRKFNLGTAHVEETPAEDFDATEIGVAWQKRAACRDADPELFYVDRGDSKGRAAQARTYCTSCPVKQRCHQDGVNSPGRWGIWGSVNFETKKSA